MTTIQRMPADIIRVTDLSPTAREVTLRLPTPLGFMAGAFVNVFMEYNGSRERRAYSISSSEEKQDEITLSIRKGRPGGMSVRFWEPDIDHVPLSIMGPLGLNTVDMIREPRIFLIAFGIGVSVIKGLVPSLLERKEVEEMTVLVGCRSEEEMLYKTYFESLAASDPRLRVIYMLSRPNDAMYSHTGHVQDYMQDYDFTGSTVYLCGTKAACESTILAIQEKGDQPAQILTEAFD